MKISIAKEKICPFMKPNFEPLRYGEPNEPYATMCIASKCMAWEYNNDCINNNENIEEDNRDGFCLRLMK